MHEVRPQLDELLFSSVEGVFVESVEVTDTSVRVEARTTVRRAACPGCGCWSGRIHGSYLRFPRDLPAVGKSVVVSLRVRRLCCDRIGSPGWTIKALTTSGWLPRRMPCPLWTLTRSLRWHGSRVKR